MVRISNTFSNKNSQYYFQLVFRFFLNLEQGLSALHTPVGSPFFLFSELYLIKFSRSRLSALHILVSTLHTPSALHTLRDSLLLSKNE